MRKVAALAGLVVAFAWPAYSQASRDADQCSNQEATPDLILRSCTAVIESGKWSGAQLSAAFYNRGTAYYGKGDHDRAIQDYKEAIRLNPQDASAFYNRGLAYSRKGLQDRAIQDYSEALRLNPSHASALYARGLAFYESGNLDRAILDFALPVELHPSHSYYQIIWLYLARARASGTATVELKKNAVHLDLAKWPGPVIRLYLADLMPEQVWRAARDSDPKINERQVCEANFYIGEYSSLHGKRTEAIALLRKAGDTCPPNFTEYAVAQAELARLEKRP